MTPRILLLSWFNLVTGFGAILALSTGETTAAEPPRPHIVLIMADDLGFADLGCYGSEIETPHLDQLANRGLRFSQFYNTAKCHSSRVCLLTGKYCFQAGNSKLDKAVTVAEALAADGYFTTMTGKWHLKDEPTDHGFQRYFGHLSGATNFFTGDHTFRLNGQPWSEFDADFYTTDANTDFAIQFIDEGLKTGKPIFTYVAYNAPHYPLQAPEEDVRKYDGRYAVGWDAIRQARYRRQLASGLVDPQFALSERPDYIPAWNELTSEEQDWETRRMAVFAAMVDRVDQNIGRLVEHLKQREMFENTLFLFCSDNGACPFERTRGKELDPWDPKSYWCYDVGWAHVGNTPLRWYKQNQHEGGISSPLIVHWPAGLSIEPGTITHQPGHLIDLMATCLDVAGTAVPTMEGGEPRAPIQGQSLRPIFEGQQRAGHPWLYFQFADNRAIRRGDWKLVSARGGRWELYNIAEDRSELHDLASEHPELVTELRALWHEVSENVDGTPKNLRKPVSERLKTFPPSSMTKRAAGPNAKR